MKLPIPKIYVTPHNVSPQSGKIGLPAGSMAEQWNNRALFRLLWPLLVEQVLGITIGLADTIMVSAVGEYAVSGVSIVDAINVLLVIAFGALSTGGSVVVSQYIGRRDMQSASCAAKQLMYVSLGVSLVITGFTLALYRPLLRIIYGNISPEVMTAAETYFWLSALSYPFLAIYNAAASLFRSMGNSRITMLIALLVNVLHIVGNAAFIYGFHLGVAGAAISTLISRIAAAIILVILLMSPRLPLSLSGLFKIHIDSAIIRSILNVGIPSGLESSMFQLGKIMVSRIFTTFGTAAIAANAVAGSIGSFVYMPGQGFGIALLTIVGQCVGARDYESARRYTAKLMKLVYGVVVFSNLMVLIFMENLVNCFSLTSEAHELTKNFLMVHCISSSLLWPLSFALPNALRAAGDARYCMIVASISMWTVRVSAAYLLAYPLGLGPIGVWFAMGGDFCLRSACYSYRWLHGRWQEKRVI